MLELETIEVNHPINLEHGIPHKDSLHIGTVETTPWQETTHARHTDEQLLNRAREVNASGKFIFSCYSELNTFLLLKAQEEILEMQNKLHESVKGIGEWTSEDSESLQKKLTAYRTAALSGYSLDTLTWW
jgi:hypothetical protein